ncbi:hypothetical protein B5F53_14755 [Blautia sp. An249]|uniref:CarD family transcriptional regulator n=1 Tax=Blautia sp. An249 TaxID=1965603 RepID=UPI000B39F3C3|nr:CarD family transcriptional regulator [Blautia sp. An249]OUO77205.1 hypothetical protein B5F53_14755 [Blautia sp. An249]
MFREGDYIVHGNVGVCQVKEIGMPDFLPAARERLYYTLLPYNTKGSLIFTPVDNQKVVMRPLMTAKEAREVIDYVQKTDVQWCRDEKKREADYKEAIRCCNGKKLGMMVKEIRQHKRLRTEKGKKIPFQEERYCRIAEDNLFGELTLVLGIRPEEIKERIFCPIKQA